METESFISLVSFLRKKKRKRKKKVEGKGNQVREETSESGNAHGGRAGRARETFSIMAGFFLPNDRGRAINNL